MNLVIKHRSGKSNSNADVLSRVPIATVCAIGTSTTFAEEGSDKIALKFECIQAVQREDPSLCLICEYIEHNILPTDEKYAIRLVLESRSYELRVEYHPAHAKK